MIIELLISHGRSFHDSNQHTAPGYSLPDYGFLLDKLCVFRAEEKSPTNTDDPKKELAQKLEWPYDPTPYVLGYYATGTKLALVVISANHPPQIPGERSIVHDIARANSEFRKDRIMDTRRLFNLSRLF